MDCHPGHIIIAPHLDLTSVQPSSHLDAQGPNGVANGRRALDGPSGSVERGQETVTGVVDLPAPESLQLTPDSSVVGIEQVSPLPTIFESPHM
jgi:hypothetical protein